MLELAKVIKIEDNVIMWYVTVLTDKTLLGNKSKLMVLNKKYCLIVDVALTRWCTCVEGRDKVNYEIQRPWDRNCMNAECQDTSN